MMACNAAYQYRHQQTENPLTRQTWRIGVAKYRRQWLSGVAPT